MNQNYIYIQIPYKITAVLGGSYSRILIFEV